MNKSSVLFNKTLVIGIIFLLVGIGFIPSTIGIKNEKNSIKILGENGYIQSRIDKAYNGDTIKIPSGTYYENIVIDKPITLIGKDKETTIIHGINQDENVISINSNFVKVTGFTIQNCLGLHYAGLRLINSSFCTIYDNIVQYNHNYGFDLEGSCFNRVFDNIMQFNNHGITCGGFDKPSSFNVIKNNSITYNDINGIGFAWSKRNVIFQNIITNNEKGIQLHYTHKNTFHRNIISNNSLIAIHLVESRQNNFICNNIQNNVDEVYFRIMNPFKNNRFFRNYWDEPFSQPKIIHGELQLPGEDIKWLEFDWFPAKEPYNI
jgi:parallel beta-helix repeat protein